MSKIIKIKLQALEEGQYDIEEMIINGDGAILRVIPKAYNEEYKGMNLFIETCERGKSPTLLRALAIYNLMLPCIVTEVTDWTNEDYASFETISLYPVTITKDYTEEIYHKEMAITLNKDDLYPLYQKFNYIMGIEECLRNEQSTLISFPVRIDENNLKQIFKSRCPIALLMKRQLIEWKRVFPKAFLMIEYNTRFSNI